MKLLTHDKPFFPSAWEDKFKYLKAMGFDGFEIDGAQLIKDFPVIKAASEKTDFPIEMVCGGYDGWIGDFDETRRNTGLSQIREMLILSEQIGAKGIVVPASWGMFSRRLPPMIPPRTEAEDERVLLDSLRFLDQVASETNTTVYVEPLNRYEDYMLNHTEDAIRLIKKGRFTRIQVCFDFFHMNIEESLMDAAILQHSEWIGHIHLASSHRFQPGSGHMDYQPGLKALHTIKYNQCFSFECRVIGDDPDLAYKQSVRFIRDELKKAGF